MSKWKLMVTTLPVVAAVTAIKAALEFGAGWGGAVDFSDVGVVVTAGVFLTGFLLAGTLADYKEAEKIPGQVATTLEVIEEILVLASSNRPAVDLPSSRRRLLALTDTIVDWFYGRKTSAVMFEALGDFNGVLQMLEQNGAGPYASRGVPQLANLRTNLSRADVIKRTSFLPPAYALLETVLALVVGLMLAARYKSLLAEFVLVPVLTLIYVYMLRLIRDVDDPFDYTTDGRQRGGAEVELFPITEYRERLARRGA